MAEFFINAISIGLADGTTGWVTVDISAHVPVGATLVAILARGTTATAEVGAKHPDEPGDANFRGLTILGGNPTLPQLVCGVSATRTIQLYRVSGQPSNYYLQGYWDDSESASIVPYIDKSIGASAAWTTIDSSASIPAGAKFAVFTVKGVYTIGYNFRNQGSADSRTAVFGNAIFGVITPIDASRECQVWIETAASANIALIGYITQGTTKVGGLDKSLGGTGAYTDIDLSADAPSGAVAALIEVKSTSETYSSFLHKEGSADDYYYRAYFNQRFVVGLDASKLCEGKISNLNVDYFVLGYFAETSETISTGDGTLPAMAGNSGYWATYGDGQLPLIEGYAVLITIDNIGIATLPAMTGTGQLEPALGGYSDLPLMDSTGMVLVGEICYADLVLPALIGDAATPLLINSIGLAELPALLGSGTLLVGELLVGSAILPVFISTGQSAVYSATISTAYLILPALSGEGYMNPAAIEQYQVYALNLKNLGLSKYTNFNYNSLCKFQGKYYGINSTGLYLLEGDKDNGTEIDAIVETGRDDMNMRNLKRIVDAFITMKAKGEYILTLVNKDGTEYDYPIVSRVTTLETYKADTGRGTLSQLWGLKFKNIAGAKFEVESVELNVAETKKRHG